MTLHAELVLPTQGGARSTRDGKRHSGRPKCRRDTMGNNTPRSPRVPHPREQLIHASRRSHGNAGLMRIACITDDSPRQPRTGAPGWKGREEGRECHFRGRQHKNHVMNTEGTTAHGGTLKRAARKPFDARARSRPALTTRSPLTRPRAR